MTSIMPDDDIKYLREKLEKETNLHERKKIERQIELLEDAVVIYKLTRKESEIL
jgi:hypothetical protein